MPSAPSIQVPTIQLRLHSTFIYIPSFLRILWVNPDVLCRVLNHLYHYEGLFQLEMIHGISSVYVTSLLESSITRFVYDEASIINLSKKYSTSYTVCLVGSHSVAYDNRLSQIGIANSVT